MNLLGIIILLVKKDFKIELRSRELLLSMTLLSVLMVLIFAFAFIGEARPVVEIPVGVIWGVMIYSGTLAAARFFEREREGDTLQALSLAPIPKISIYLSKVIVISLFMVFIEMVSVLATQLFFSTQGTFALSMGVLLSGTIGFAAVAALFGPPLGRVRSRDLLLTLIIFPLVVPLLIAGTRGSSALLRSGIGSGTVAIFWLKFLLVFDLIFITLGLWLFEPILKGDA